MDTAHLFPSFIVDVAGIIELISTKDYSKVVIQGPEGMKRGLIQLADLIEKETGSTILLDGEPCYGACDHAGERAKLLGADALIHLGHSDIPSMERGGSVPIHFFHTEMRAELGIVHDGLRNIIKRIGDGSVSLFTTIQHLGLLKEVRSYLENAGMDVHIGDPGGREEFPGQVLGCSFSPASDLPSNVTSLVFVGTGRFHPLGLCMASKKEVHTLDPMTGEVGLVSKDDLDRVLRTRFGNINKMKEMMAAGEIVGIVIGFKPGQRRAALAEEMLSLLKESGKKGRLVIMDHMDPMKLKILGFRIAVSTACSRIAMDDSLRYSREDITMLTPVELKIALDIVKWSDYSFDDEW